MIEILESSRDASATPREQTRRPSTRSAWICFVVAVSLMLAGPMQAVGFFSFFAQRFAEAHPLLQAANGFLFLILIGLLFERSRTVAAFALMGTATICFVCATAAFSGYLWYTVWTTGMDPSGEFPLFVSPPQSALSLLGLLILVVCIERHTTGGGEHLGWRIFRPVVGFLVLSVFLMGAILVVSSALQRQKTFALPEIVCTDSPLGNGATHCREVPPVESGN